VWIHWPIQNAWHVQVLFLNGFKLSKLLVHLRNEVIKLAVVHSLCAVLFIFLGFLHKVCDLAHLNIKILILLFDQLLIQLLLFCPYLFLLTSYFLLLVLLTLSQFIRLLRLILLFFTCSYILLFRTIKFCWFLFAFYSFW